MKCHQFECLAGANYAPHYS